MHYIVQLLFYSSSAGSWPRLQSDHLKPHWVKVDFDHFEVSDSEEEVEEEPTDAPVSDYSLRLLTTPPPCPAYSEPLPFSLGDDARDEGNGEANNGKRGNLQNCSKQLVTLSLTHGVGV